MAYVAKKANKTPTAPAPTPVPTSSTNTQQGNKTPSAPPPHQIPISTTNTQQGNKTATHTPTGTPISTGKKTLADGKISIPTPVDKGKTYPPKEGRPKTNVARFGRRAHRTGPRDSSSVTPTELRRLASRRLGL